MNTVQIMHSKSSLVDLIKCHYSQVFLNNINWGEL